jgi:hypothetical protein
VYIQYNLVQYSTCMVSHSVQQLFVRPTTSDSTRWYSCTVEHCSWVHCPHSTVYETRWICQLLCSQCGECMYVCAMAQNSAQSAHTYTKALHGKQCDVQRKLWCTHALASQSLVTAVTRHHSATRIRVSITAVEQWAASQSTCCKSSAPSVRAKLQKLSA